jgi:GAF domain-containing protein
MTPATAVQEHDLAAQLERVRLESDTLYRVVGVVASAPDLGRLLASLVDLLTEATDCHACFVYLREGAKLQLRSASRIYAHMIGRIELGLDDSLAGWVARHGTPSFIRDNAVADPRMKYVPEVDEEHFQSIVAVPIPARSGEVLGVVVLHTVAPREFDENVMTFLAHTASLVAGAIENARMYEATRRRVDALTKLSALGRDIAAAGGQRGALYRVVTTGVRGLLDCEVCQLYLLEPETGSLEPVAADPAVALPDPREGTSALLELLHQSPAGDQRALALHVGEHTAGVLTAAVAAGEEKLGVLVAVGARRLGEAEELLRAVAHQVAVALKQVDLIERLTDKYIIRDLFEALATGRLNVAEDLARAARCDLEGFHVFLALEPAPEGGARRGWLDVAEHAEKCLRRISPSAFCRATSESLRALVSLPAPPNDAGLEQLDRELDRIGTSEHVVIGRSEVRRGAGGGQRSLREAADAVRVAAALRRCGGSLAYDQLGAYRYLIRVPADDSPEDVHVEAVQRLADYDRRRQSQLVETLERYLVDQRSVSSASRALYIHRNTLRQRLARIQKLSGLDLSEEDSLTLELAIKVVRLRAAGTAG